MSQQLPVESGSASPGDAHLRPITLLVIDAHDAYRRAFVSLFEIRPGFRIVGAASCPGEGAGMALKLSPDVVILGLGYAQVAAFEALREVVNAFPHAKVVVLWMSFDDVKLGARFIEAGAAAVTQKDAAIDQIEALIVEVCVH